MKLNEIGQILGCVLFGFLTDRMRVRSLLLPFTMLVATSNYIVLSLTPAEQVGKIDALIFLSGVLLGGP